MWHFPLLILLAEESVTAVLHNFMWPGGSRQLMRDTLPISACVPFEHPNSTAKIRLCGTSIATSRDRNRQLYARQALLPVSTWTEPKYCGHIELDQTFGGLVGRSPVFSGARPAQQHLLLPNKSPALHACCKYMRLKGMRLPMLFAA